MNTEGMRQWWKPVGILAILLLLSATGAAAIDNTFLLDFVIVKDEGIENISVEITDDDVRIPHMGKGEYSITLKDQNGVEMFSTRTHTTFVRRSLIQAYTVNKTGFRARVPYHDNITTVEFSRDGEWSSTIDLPENICSSNPDEVCLPYCAGKGVDPDCGDTSSGLPLLTILAVLIIIVLLGAGAYVYREHKKKQELDIDLNF